MSVAQQNDLAFTKVKGFDQLQVSKTLVTPGGHHFQAIMTADHMTLTSEAGDTILVTGPGVREFSISGLVGAVGDGLLGVLGAAKKLLGCTPTSTTTVNVGSDGKVTSIQVIQTCVAS